MTTFRASVTSKGQLTLPAEVRRNLGVNVPGTVDFDIAEDGTVTLLVRHIPTFQELYGSIPALPNESADLEREIELAMEEEAIRYMQKSNLR
jgi:bifunctional DNA-binding transcriptional regulator/antitoxin component of YhaV-PrlF toxin-antitoxin module